MINFICRFKIQLIGLLFSIILFILLKRKITKITKNVNQANQE